MSAEPQRGDRSVLQRAIVPPPPLADCVALLWLYEGYAPPHATERLLPTGTVELVIDLRANGRGEGVVCGAHSEYFELDTANAASVIGVHFRPGGAFPFFRLPLAELHNRRVRLGDVWGAAAAELRERLLAANTAEARFRILIDRLLAMAVRPPARSSAVARALRAFEDGSARTVAQAADRVGLSRQRFSERFGAEVGLTPTLFRRVRRFQQVVRVVHPAARIDWARVALECGYFDQAHFIHDFRAFTGLTPSAYLAQRTEHANHVRAPA